MNILNQKTKDNFTKPEVEQQEQEKQEYKIFGTFIRRKGMKLFQYNSTKDELEEIYIQPKTQMSIGIENGKLKDKDEAYEEAVVDSRYIHFEALNWKNARKRVSNYKKGKLKELSNLRILNGKDINPI